MKKLRLWLYKKMIMLCNYCLQFSDGADDQEDINGVIATKNEFIRKLKALESDNG